MIKNSGVSKIKRLLMRLGKCPYCTLHYLPPSGLRSHLEWRHASKRREWSGNA